MTIHSLSLIGDSSGTARTTADDGVDYSAYSDDQLIAERERRERRHLQPVLTSASGAGPSVTVEADVDRITEELMRRARSRHPSSFRPVS